MIAAVQLQLVAQQVRSEQGRARVGHGLINALVHADLNRDALSIIGGGVERELPHGKMPDGGPVIDAEMPGDPVFLTLVDVIASAANKLRMRRGIRSLSGLSVL